MRFLNSAQGAGEGAAFRLLRSTHILAAVVRETLEAGPVPKEGDHPLSFSQLVLLRRMSFEGEVYVGEAAAFLGVSAAAATKTVDKLERLGLIVRSPSSDDRRATLLSVSARGRRLVEHHEELEAERLAPLLATLAPGEMSDFARVLDRLAISLLERQGLPDGQCLRCAAYLDCDCEIGKLRGGCPHESVAARLNRPSGRKPVSTNRGRQRTWQTEGGAKHA